MRDEHPLLAFEGRARRAQAALGQLESGKPGMFIAGADLKELGQKHQQNGVIITLKIYLVLNGN